MKIAGIVCEYNPMHSGHIYQIEQTRRNGVTHIACVMSGNFVQRGECAVLDKWSRADIAVHSGADLVVLLPAAWSLDSAQNFAFGALSVLKQLKTDVISFGSECGDKELLCLAAKASEDERVGEVHRQGMKNGLSYPLALSNAVTSVYGKEVGAVLSSPNNTLAVEYLKAMKRLNFSMEILPVKRQGSPHDSNSLSDEFASATAIRNNLDAPQKLKPFLTEYALSVISAQKEMGYAPCSNLYAERAILSELRSMTKEQYKRLLSDNTDLAERIYNCASASCSLNELYENIKTKNVTLSRVRRSVLRLYLGIEDAVSKREVPFVRVLAANERGLEIIRNAKRNTTVITKHSETKNIDLFSKKVYETECRTSDLFALFSEKIRVGQTEMTTPAIFIK